MDRAISGTGAWRHGVDWGGHFHPIFEDQLSSSYIFVEKRSGEGGVIF